MKNLIENVDKNMGDFRVSIVVPCYNEEKNIGDCLESLICQDYKKNHYEIVVVDGNSTDRTRDIVKQYQAKHENIRLLVNPKRTTSSNRNVGVNNAEYDYVALIDGDCIAPKDWLKTLVEGYRTHREQDESIVAVGGANMPPKRESKFVEAIGVSLNTFLGSFGSIQGKIYEAPKIVPSLATLNALYEKEKMLEVGLFDESLRSDAEDADFNFRLTQKGYKLLFLPNSFVWHKMRPTPRSWMKNMFRYGRGRALLLKKHRSTHSFLYLLPPLFILVMLSPLLSFFHWIFLLPLAYFPFIFLISIYECLKTNKFALTFHVMLAYISTHFAYGIGEIYGLFFRKYSSLESSSGN